MNKLKHLRQEACSNVAALYKIGTTRRDQPQLLEYMARMLNRSVRTLRRWEQDPNPDPLIEYAYRYLAGRMFGWPGWQINLKHDQVRLWHSAVSYTSIPRQRIEGFDYNEQLQQQLIRAQQDEIEELRAELELAAGGRQSINAVWSVLKSFLRKFTRTTDKR